jgi:lysophospholipase L1-like esterase
MRRIGRRASPGVVPEQRQFPFRERSERLDRLFRRGIVATTLLALVALVGLTPTGRYMSRRVGTWTLRAGWAALGVPPSRTALDAEWASRRHRDVASATATFHRVYDESSPAVKRLLDFAGMGRETALLRWGNYDKILVLPSAVFAPDDSGRSYRLRPNLRSVWLRGVDLTHGMNGFFLVPDTPDLPAVLRGTTASIVPGTAQTTNSWGCRGPEPDPSAPIRGLILGDSNMQGYFVGDDETPPAYLARDLEKRLGVRVSLLNTGHLGYSLEQYYSSLAEYTDRLRPTFVLLALCVNDFGDFADVVAGRADWDDARYWLDRIDAFCRTRGILCITTPIPYDSQVTALRLEGGYPGRVNDLLRSGSLFYCFPIEDLVDEFMRLRVEAQRSGRTLSANPLFNLHLGDHHFSPRGAEVWGRALGRRIAVLLEMSRARGGVAF